ncbi:hypothetical protein EMIT0P265_30686 [Pseudomonas zeae]
MIELSGSATFAPRCTSIIQSGICLRLMVAVRMAPSGAPGWDATGPLTCAQLPPFCLAAKWMRL